MKKLKWILIFSALTLAGCSPQANDRIVPSSPSYTQAGFPNPLVIFNSYLATGLTLNVYEYPTSGVTPAGVSISLADQSFKPAAGQSNLLNSVSNYNGDTWVGFPILSTGAVDLTSGNYSQLTFYVMGGFATPAGATQPVTTGVISFNGLGTATVPVTVTTSWQAVSIPVSGTLSGPANTVLFMSNFYSASVSAPVTAFIDQIQYQ